MKSPLAQLVLLTVVVGLGLWGGVKWFLKGTHEYSSSLDVRSLSYLRDDQSTNPSPPSEDDKAADSSALQSASPALYARPDARENVQELAEDVDEQLEEVLAEEEEEPEPEVEEEQETDEQIEAAAQVVSGEEEIIVEMSAAEQIALSETLAGTETVSAAIDRVAGSPQSDAVALSKNELEERENARLKRLEALGLVMKKQPAPTVAIDASLSMPDHCSGATIARVPVSLRFRYESSIIRGESLNALEALVALYRQCDEGEFILAENPLGRQDATEVLTQMRFDEVKYFFIQHSVSIDVVQFPEIK